MSEREERRIIRTGERLAAQLGVVFEIVPEKLRGYRARATPSKGTDRDE